MWRFNSAPGKNCLLEKTCRVTVGGRNLPGGSSETTPTTIHPPTLGAVEFYSPYEGLRQLKQDIRGSVSNVINPASGSTLEI
jgi:hypothetical protein